MFGKMKKMFKDEEGTGILAGLGGAVGGAILGCVPGSIGTALLALVPGVGWNLCCPQCLGVAALGGGCAGALGGVLGGLCGGLIDYAAIGAASIVTTASACFGSVASCINFIPSLMGGK